MSSGQSTRYRVEITLRAALDLEAIYVTVDAGVSSAASAWYDSLERVISDLDSLPHRGAAVPEDQTLRQLLHGKKPHVYRIIYRTDHDTKSVSVIHIRHGARQPVQQEDLQ